jgi:hypothetical protein
MLSDVGGVAEEAGAGHEAVVDVESMSWPLVSCVHQDELCACRRRRSWQEPFQRADT